MSDTLEQYLTGTVYPDVTSNVTTAYNDALAGQSPPTGLAGILNDLQLPGGGPVGALQGGLTSIIGAGLGEGLLASLGIGALPTLFDLLGNLLYKNSPPAQLTAADFPWVGGSQGYGTIVPTTVGGQINLPTSGTAAQAETNLGSTATPTPGEAAAYPFGAGAPYTPGSGIYQFTGGAGQAGQAGQTQSYGNPSFFEPGTNPQTYYQTDYFGNVIGGPYSIGGFVSQPGSTAVTTAGDQPLGYGAAEPAWLAADFASWTGTGGQAPSGTGAPAYGQSITPTAGYTGDPLQDPAVQQVAQTLTAEGNAQNPGATIQYGGNQLFVPNPSYSPPSGGGGGH